MPHEDTPPAAGGAQADIGLPSVPATRLGPEYQGETVRFWTMVTLENAQKGLGAPGERVCVTGMIHHAERVGPPVSYWPVMRLVLDVIGHSELMAFTLGRHVPVTVIHTDG